MTRPGKSLALPHYGDIERVRPTDFSRTDYLRLDMNEKPYSLPEEIIKDILGSITPEKVSTYPEVFELYNRVSKQYSIDQEKILFTNGSSSAIRYTFQTYIEKGDSILGLKPTYAMVPIYSKIFRANYMEVPFDNKLRLDIGKMIDRIQNGNLRLFYLANPNSPTGTVINDTDMKRLFETTYENDVILVLDEAYTHFYSDGYIHDIDNFPNLVVIRTFSKYFGLPSVRLGMLVSNPINTNDIFKSMPTYEVNSFAVHFGMKIFDFEDELEKYEQDFIEGKKKVISFCGKNKLEFIDTKTHFVYIRVGIGLNTDLANWLKSEKKILVKAEFGFEPLDDCIRFTIGNEGQMEYLLESIEEFLSKK